MSLSFLTIFANCILKTKMKKILYTIILAAAFTACSDNIALTPAISLFSGSPEILEETAVFRLATANMPDSTERIFPVTFGGSAERGVDYEASADAFVFGGESPVEAITVTTLKFGTEKTLSMTVSLPEGMESGKYLTAEYKLHDKPAFITFDYGYKISTDSTVVRFLLTDREGNGKAINNDIDISILVDKQKSTAVEGSDFEFADSSHLTIKAGKNQGELKIKNLKSMPETGKDRIVLSFKHDEKFGDGEYHEMEIGLMEGRWKKLDGNWMTDTLITDETFMKAYWGEKCSGYDLLPKLGRFDSAEFDMEACLFKPIFMSGLELYFTGDSFFRKGSVRALTLTDGTSAEIQTFLLDNTNRYFSEDLKSEDKESFIGVRILEGGEEKADTLDLYIIDHTSRTFMPELEADGKYAPQKPVAASPGQYLNMRFIK